MLTNKFKIMWVKMQSILMSSLVSLQPLMNCRNQSNSLCPVEWTIVCVFFVHCVFFTGLYWFVSCLCVREDECLQCWLLTVVRMRARRVCVSVWPVPHSATFVWNKTWTFIIFLLFWDYCIKTSNYHWVNIVRIQDCSCGLRIGLIFLILLFSNVDYVWKA